MENAGEDGLGASELKHGSGSAEYDPEKQKAVSGSDGFTRYRERLPGRPGQPE